MLSLKEFLYRMSSRKEISVEIYTDLPCFVANLMRPDDVDIPQGMLIDHRCVDGRYLLMISVEVRDGSDVLSLKNTVDELIRLIKLVAGLKL